MASRVLLILGYGANVGKHTASEFSQNGYKIAVASRRVTDGFSQETGYFGVKADFSQPDSVASVFSTVERELGTPNVVLYNAVSSTTGANDDPLSPPLSNFSKDMHTNYFSLLAAAKEAVRGFRTLPSSVPKTFFFTGNKLNDPSYPMPQLLSMAAGKVAASYIIRDSAGAYTKDGFRFYYVDERQSTGMPIFMDISGHGHAEEFLKLAEKGEPEPWLYTFVNGAGYKKFD